MARKLRIDSEINLKVNTSTKSLDRVKEDLLAINKGFPGIGDVTVEKLEEVSKDVNKVKKNAIQDLASGAITNPDTLNKYIADINKQEIALRDITDETIKRIANDKKSTQEIKKATQSIEAQERVLKSKEQILDSIRQKTQAVTKMEQEVSRSTGVSISALQDPSKIQAEIAKRQTASGKPKDEQARKEIAEFEKLLKIREEIEAQDKDILANQQKIESEIEQQNIDLEKAKQYRRDALNKAIDIAEAEGKRTKGVKGITKEQATQLRHLVAQDKEIGDIGKGLKEISYKKQSQEINQNIKANQKFNKTLKEGKKGFLQNVTAATVYYAALRAVRQIIRSVTKTVTELDKSFTEIAMVTNLNRKEAWQLADGYQNLAKEVGTTTDQIAKLAVFFARQGRSASDAFELTKVAAMAAKVASIDATESANFLTSAINGFGLAIDQAMDVSDKFAALGASSASSYQEMAVALSKVAPSAKVAGVNIDQMLGFLAKGIETTREAPENIGTAFKTVFARMTQLRDFGKTLEEGVAVNTVEEALATAGVALRDNQGNFRDMGNVLTELGYKFEGLTRNQQAYIATALAGTRQQSRLLAVMQNFDRTMELVEVSVGASGATLAQHAEYSGGMEAANARLQTSWQQVITSFASSDIVIGAINAMTKGLEILSGSVSVLVLGLTTMVAILAISKAVTLAKAAATAIDVAVTKMITAAIAKQGIATTLTTAKTIGLGKALAIATGGITLIIGAIVGLISYLSKLPSSTEKSTEKIKEFKVEMYNANKEIEDFGNLIDSFDELDKKVFKTTEDLKEMDGILKKIAEYGGEENNFVIGGQIDREAVDLFLEEQRKIVEEAQEGIRLEGSKNVERFLNGEEQTPETRASIIEYLASVTEGFDEMDESVQNRIRLAISQNVEGYAKAFEKSEKTFRVTAGGSIVPVIEKTYENQIKPATEKMLIDFNDIFTGELEEDQALKLFENFLLLDPSEQKLIEDAYANQLGDVLKLGNKVIEDFLGKGYSLGQIQSIVSGIEDALEGFQALDFGGADPSGPMYYGPDLVEASDIASYYAGQLSRQDAEDPNTNKIALDATIQYIERLQLTSEETEAAIRSLTNTLTDPMAFKTGMDEIRSATNSIESLMQASQDMAEGTLPDNLEYLVNTYPQLAEQIRSGTLTMKEAYEATSDELSDSLQRKINDLRAQEAIAIEGEKERIQAQIDMLEYYKNNPALLMNEEDMVDEAVTEMEDRYKSEIDFIKSLNSAKKEEIDLMQQKLEMNKSMLDIDRQIAALSRDTSYGAQARLSDLRDQQKNEALEREKFVMDLITEQAISELEEESRQAVLTINDNVRILVEEITGTKTTNDSFPPGTGEVPTG